MMDDNGVKIVSSKVKDGIGTLTVQVPEANIDKVFQQKLHPASGSFALGGFPASNLGSRYGLRTSQQISIPTDRLGQIKLARDLYRSEPMVANVIDLMVDLCCTGMYNESPNKEVVEFYDKFCKYADFDELHRQIFLEYWVGSDIFIMRGKQRFPNEDSSGKYYYYDYTVLNPEYVEVAGTMLVNSEVITLKIPEDLATLISSGSKADKKLAKQVPLRLRRAAESGRYTPDQETMSRISRKKQAYERYATPFLTRIFEPVLLKRRMREADAAVAETVRTVLVTYTIGSDDFPATPADMKKLEDVISTPAKSMELIWNHTLKVEYHYPDSNLFTADKYQQVNSDILQGLGIPPVLIDGGGGTFATAWTSLLAVIERLEAVRRQVIRWQEEEYRKIGQDNGYKEDDIPSVYFRQLNLRDDKVFANIMTSLYDRGLVSKETMLDFADIDFDAEVRRLTAEKKTLKGIFEPPAPPTKPATTGGRPNDTLDKGNYTSRDKTPAPKGAGDQINEKGGGNG
jgi:hypothetical protein